MVFVSSLRGSFCLCSCRCFCFSLMPPRLAYRILRWKLGSTNYNRVVVVKTPYDQLWFLSLPFVEAFAFVLAVAFVSRSCHQGSLTESCGGSLVPPTITVSSLSRHPTTSYGFCLFPSWKLLPLFLPLLLFLAHATKARLQNPAVEAWFHQPSIRSYIVRP